MKNKKMLRMKISGLIAAILVLLLVIYGCYFKIRENLQLELEQTLQDVAAQNVLAVETEISDKFRLMHSLSRELAILPQEKDTILDNMRPFVENYGFKRMGYISLYGTAYTTDGYIQNIAFRDFFQEGLKGNAVITDAMEDAIGDIPELINVISVPICNPDTNEVMGVLFASYQSERFQDTLNVESFNGMGYSYIIKEDGSLIAASKDAPMHGDTNIFSHAIQYSSSNRTVIHQLMEDINAGNSGTIHYLCDGARDAYYMPLEIADGNIHWYMMTVVPSQVLHDRLTPVMQIVMALLIFIVAAAALSIFLYLYSYHKAQKELMRLAYEDSITKGANFACFKEQLSQKSGSPGYLVAMDLNGFKIINNTCGVEMGDETLRRMWEIFEQCLHKEDLCARVNADRFILFLDETDQTAVEKRILQLAVRICALPELLNVPRIHPSFGIYYFNGTETIENAYSHAIQAKHLIKGHMDRILAFYDEVDAEEVILNRQMEDAFDEALRSRQFEVWYQPKYSVDGFSLVGAEALIRWRTPEGYLSPGKFIPLFEKNGMISKLDEYVFAEVCRQQKEWEAEGRKLVPVSVNISRASLYYENIVEKYQNILKEYQLNPEYIQLEITESATIDNSNISHLISDFHDAGFWLLLDDFGNGYSSLAALNVMHFDTLKLDKSLIDYIGDKNGETLLYHVTKLAQNLGLLVTAEGVETEEQVTFLQEVECNDIQGYYFSKPLPMGDYEKLLSA